MSEIRFTVFGVPVPKARARTVRLKNGKSHSFTPDKTAHWEARVVDEAIAHLPQRIMDGPLVLEATFYLLKPKSKPKKVLYPAGRPDLDNLIKSITDACNGLLWTDDARIVDIKARKEYGSPPRVEVSIREVNTCQS
jgi:Holliday junction resolvase RusA-like endonuclease